MSHEKCAIECRTLKINGDDRPRQGIIFAMCTSRANDLVKSLERLNAKNLVAKAKGILSPFYGMNDFAPAFALA